MGAKFSIEKHVETNGYSLIIIILLLILSVRVSLIHVLLMNEDSEADVVLSVSILNIIL